AQQFTTDPQGWELSRITLNMGDAKLTGGGFTLELRSNNDAGTPLDPADDVPGPLVATLSGNSDPATAGNYDYSPAATINLARNTSYWILARVSDELSIASYSWNFTDSTTHTGSGTLGLAGERSDAGWDTFQGFP